MLTKTTLSLTTTLSGTTQTVMAMGIMPTARTLIHSLRMLHNTQTVTEMVSVTIQEGVRLMHSRMIQPNGKILMAMVLVIQIAEIIPIHSCLISTMMATMILLIHFLNSQVLVI